MTNVTSSIEADLSYYYAKKVRDPGVSGDVMYKIWYGVEGRGQSRLARAQLVWLAVPPGVAAGGQGTLVRLVSTNNRNPLIYGRPPDDSEPATPSKAPPESVAAGSKRSSYIIGGAPGGAIFVTAYTYAVTLKKRTAQTLWYEINYDHRQAWMPASEVELVNQAT